MLVYEPNTYKNLSDYIEGNGDELYIHVLLKGWFTQMTKNRFSSLLFSKRPDMQTVLVSNVQLLR